jgi:hypothetical protein
MSLKGRSCWVVNIRMDDAEKLSLEGICRFVEASEEIRFEAADRQQLYGWVERVLVGQGYAQQGKTARGLLRRYIEKMTGLSRAQVTRRIAISGVRLCYCVVPPDLGCVTPAERCSVCRYPVAEKGLPGRSRAGNKKVSHQSC